MEKKYDTISIEAIINEKMGPKAKYIPKFLIRWFEDFLHLDYINGGIQNDYKGAEFCRETIKYLGVTIEVEGLENLDNVNGRYTIASNHPLGAIDGVTLGALIGREYDGNLKYLLNDLLMNLKGMAPLGIPINKLGGQARNLPILVSQAYHSEKQMLVFPAGLCSRKIDGKITDLPWTKSFVKLSRETGRDIIPIHFEGENSKRFYRIANLQKKLGLKFNIAMMLLPDEMYRSTGRKYRITFGKPISISSLDKSKSDYEWAQVIRAKAYEL
jgi:putative hemolysin